MKTTNEDSPGTEERGEVKTLPPVKLKRLRRAKLLRMCQSNENFYDYHSQQQTLINFQKVFGRFIFCSLSQLNFRHQERHSRDCRYVSFIFDHFSG